MKKFFLLTVFALISLFLCLDDAKAALEFGGIYNGAGVPGGSGSGVAGCPAGKPYCMYNTNKNNDVTYAAYIVRVIYYKGGNSQLSGGNPSDGTVWRQIGKPVVVVGGDGGDLKSQYQIYATGKGASLKLNNGFAQQLYNVEKGNSNRSNVQNYLNANDNANAKILFSAMDANDQSLYTKKNNRAKSDGSSYGKAGYRMIVEKIIVANNFGTRYVTTRKAVARSATEHGTADACGWWWVESAQSCAPNRYGTAAYSNTYWGEIHTAFDDINVKRKGSNGEIFGRGNLKSYNRGAGLHIYDPDLFDELVQNHNYYIDTACTNCDSNSKNGSFIIQDITDWDAILASKDSDKDNIKNYYNKGDGVYCREEYKVDFPNANNKVDVDGEKLFNVATGRYFTVNLQEPFVKGGIANFGPIKVTKVRQCQGTDQAKLNEFVNRYGAGQLGTITLNYKEERGKPYTLNVKLKENSDRTNPKNEVSSDGKTTTITTTKYYELPDNIYRYIKKGEGTPSETPPPSLTNYIDLKISTLPVSFSNFATGGSKVGGTISLSYELPTKGTGSGEDPKTNIKKAFDNKDYFENPAGSENIYNKYSKDNNLQGDELNQIKNSSCAKMFGYKTTEFKSCVEQRTTDATTDKCRDMANGEYTCDVNVCEENETVGPDGKCCEIGKCGNAPVCRIENGKFYDQLNNEISEAEFIKQCICEVLDNGQYILRDGKLTDKYPEYLQQCPNDCPPEEQCPPETWINGDPCAKCPSGACPMPGGICPYGGDVIYRPIDLINPFPSQQGSGRQTGSNWCGYKLATGKITCAGDESNEIVKTHITNNRGVANYSIYNKKTPLYKVELDANKIKEIRDYNKTNDYNDWKNIECNSTSGVCYSTFLRSKVNVTGECSSDLKTCAEK